jgi:phage terminase small subunit
VANRHAGSNRRKSMAQHRLEGTWRADRHGEARSPEPPSGRPEVPEPLGEVGQREWSRMVHRLEQSSMLTVVDDAVLYEYCQLFEETERVRRQQDEMEASLRILEENIPDVTGAEIVQVFGQIVLLRKLIAKCTDQLRGGRTALRLFLVECGLTPASRGRIKLPVRHAPVDEFEQFAQRITRVK